MLVVERYEKIVALVNERGSIRVSELSELCGVTEETIRRDLDRLEAAGRLRRSHGGAVSVKEGQAELPYTEREIAQAEEKKRIAEEAVKRIRPGDRIILDASSTAWYMARIMPDIPLTVLTNAMRVATELAGREKIGVVATGGLLSSRTLSFVGPLAERALVDYHVDKVFLSAKGVHLERGLSESNEMQSRLKQTMIGIADEAILLVDSSKFGQQAFARVADLGDMTAVITDRGLPADVRAALADRGIPLTAV